MGIYCVVVAETAAAAGRTTATIIASQALITGAFSLTQQAIQLGLLPRFRILRTSETEKGQIYIPKVNWYLLAAVVLLAEIILRGNTSARNRAAVSSIALCD